MTNRTTNPIQFSSINSKKVLAKFTGGKITSDGGILLVREVDKKLGLTKALAPHFKDPRDPSRVNHTVLQMLRQRVYGIALGYEDLNDHDSLSKDEAFQTAVGIEGNLASSPTLCRFENTADRRAAVEINKAFVENFISSFKEKPKELILDFDATDNPIHGKQEGRAYHGYYKSFCFLPLHVFCGEQLLVSYLRKSNQDQAKHSWAILALLVKRFRKEWPKVKIVFRADGGFCRDKIMKWCDKNNVDYIIGIGGNSRLKSLVEDLFKETEQAYHKTKEKQKKFSEVEYKAHPWKKERRVIVKSEYGPKGSNLRFVITSLSKKPSDIYENTYCPRGEMENRIKEQILLFSDRNSCHKWWPNQLRLLLSGLAYVLLERLRFMALKGTQFAKSRVDTIRLKLLKIGGVIVKNTRRLQLFLSEYFPYKDDFYKIAKNLAQS